ncbi:RIP metalloprotease RseP [Pseudoxanthomonas indica]|uniref:Zinc metalloprotease n=1 Tax=Pseudoxanthomonas indica TaxID=428993 RepID=A0A1T5J837_9GAMM|nr:RIP metalloprotease RseP [Pseudoxanthomonas indica]GGD57000.1 zinc metalloprotease [Pseudoxanthomonas indica]SKC47486.1 site-2 protease. Metallo peptidase. MEROPS family M50B [Pseudoxanthomonas indica]
MSEAFGSVLWLIVAIGILVTFHEFGHFWVARRCGVKVLRFSVGFGKPLWSRKDRHGTEFAIAAIPLGGYVKMLDEAEYEVPAAQLGQAFNRKPIWQRIAIVAAGPIANLILCVALLWVMFLIGKPDYSATLGPTQGLAAQAGLRDGDRLERIDGRSTETAMDALQVLMLAAIDHRDVAIQASDANGHEVQRKLALSRLPADFDQQNLEKAIGLVWHFQVAPATVGTVTPDSASAGLLQSGDQITAIDGQAVRYWNDIAPLVKQWGERGGEAMVEVDRQGERLALLMQPRQQLNPDTKQQAWVLGITPAPRKAPEHDALRRYGPLEAIPAAFRQTGRMASDSLAMMRRMLTGEASAKSISGAITIAQVANATAQQGPATFIFFLALLSLSLAILNLLPIPVLDGGHLLYYLIELVKGSPLSERSMVAGQYIGLALLAGLMGLAFYNDILRLVT